MGFLVVVLLLVAVASGLMFRQSWHRERIERLRDRARLRVIEGQMTMLRAALRLNAAEYAARRRMHELHRNDVFTSRTDHENYRPW